MNKETICCPLCNARLRPIGGFWTCSNDHREWAGTKELWQALEIARRALEETKTLAKAMGVEIFVAGIDKALEQIEHKE